ncbi:hypothetical protein RND81_09G077700 [Saponaria officinalis]|uniref:Equilibrative nucleotide transporter 3 n=1 Tax=Saponaria officinalis TaxID=3572 RepID=A0AAW1IK67_SAPOF
MLLKGRELRTTQLHLLCYNLFAFHRRTMVPPNENGASPKLEGKHAAIIVCWLLGNGCLFPWNSMLTIEDYYVYLFPRYHSTRVLSLVYQPFALVTIALLAYNEANINTRRRNLSGYILFSVSSLAVLVLDLATSGRGGLGTYIGICVTAAAFGISDAHVQGGMVGDLSFMQPELVQSFLAGLAASGALTSTLRIFTKAFCFMPYLHFMSYNAYSYTLLYSRSFLLSSTTVQRLQLRVQKLFPLIWQPVASKKQQK